MRLYVGNNPVDATYYGNSDIKRTILYQGGAESTVSGESPLVLPNALPNSIYELVQYGQCEQATAPSPNAPVNIKCNNGTIVLKDAELPYGYKRLERINFNSSGYYDTNKKLYGSDVVTMTIDNVSTSGQNLFGCYSGTGDDAYNFSLYIYGTASGQAYWRYGQRLYRPVLGGTSEKTISFGAGGTSGFKTDVSYDTVDFETTDNAYIGALPNSSSTKFSGDIVGNITIGTRLKYIPCERVSDGAIGYYEVVEGVFLEPQGSTLPTAGAYDDAHLTAGVAGTPEVLNIGGKNLNAGTLDHVGYTSTGGTSTSTTFAGTLCQIPTKGGEKFTVSCGNITDGISGIFINTWLEDGSWNTRQAIAATGGTLTYTVGAGVGLINFTLYKTGGVELTSNSWMQVEYGSTATEYVPYITPQTASAADLFAVDDYKDTQDIITGDIIRKVGIKVLDGTEEWTENDTASTIRYRLRIDDATGGTSRSAITSSHFVYSSSGQDVGVAFLSSKFLYVIAAQTITTVEDFKAWLVNQYAAGTPVIVVYPLAEETAEGVGAQEVYTNAGTNSIKAVVNVGDTTLDVIYLKET